MTVEKAVAEFGALAKSKLDNPSATGEPEDQLRAPFEQLLSRLAVLSGFKAPSVVAVGETSLSELRTRPDYAVTVHGALAGFVELKAPGKGADPRRFKGQHDKAQWAKLSSLPNLIFCDGNSFSLWRNGELAHPPVRLEGDVDSSGDQLLPGKGLVEMFELFLRWEPKSPSTARELAEVSARLCRLLRDEVSEALGRKVDALTSLATDWRGLLFPYATDKQFADGYAQAVTFGLLMARARGITIGDDLHKVADGLKDSASLIGAALQLLTDSKETRHELKTALQTLGRVLDAVNWTKISKGNADAWLYFYENFLDTYDSDLRRLTGSYYTPPQVVTAMVSLVDQALRGPGFALPQGLAADSVTVADPATGTGTFLLGVLRHLADQATQDEGPGAVAGAIEMALRRLIAFELQLGPFAVAQLRLLAEVQALTGSLPRVAPRMYVTDTLSNPDDDGGTFPGFTAAIGLQRKAANRVKREQPITVVIGNPPYKDKAMGLGGWVEGVGRSKGNYAPLDDWQPPKEWGLGVHTKHLRNLYIYFWRWAARKVFEDVPGQGPGGGSGIVNFITAAGFLSGPGFARMRQSLRQMCHEIWVIDCSPEGYQPEVSTRLFQGVQQPVCIVLAARWRQSSVTEKPQAKVRWRALPVGHRTDKFAALQQLRLDAPGWLDCATDDRAPFLPMSEQQWSEYVPLDSMFEYGGSGVQPMRVWVIAPDALSLTERWQKLLDAPADEKQSLFHPTLRAGVPSDRHIDMVLKAQLPRIPGNLIPIAMETQACHPPMQYGARSFDRQWIIPDVRVITQPNALLWESLSPQQIYTTGLHDRHPGEGPGLTFTALPPDKHHFKGSFGGRAYPLWLDGSATRSNLSATLLDSMSRVTGLAMKPEDVLAYIAGVAGGPGYVRRFDTQLKSPGLRIPVTADVDLFAETARLGRRVLWLHTFGDRCVDAEDGRPAGVPRMAPEVRPLIPQGGSIPSTQGDFPSIMAYDPESRELHVGKGRIERVSQAMWDYKVGGNQVLVQWFNNRRQDRTKPQIGDRRPPSPLGNIQPDHWLPEYTSELLNVLNVLGLLVDLEPQADQLLGRICAGPLITHSMLESAGAFFPAGHSPAGEIEQATLPGFDAPDEHDEEAAGLN